MIFVIENVNGRKARRFQPLGFAYVVSFVPARDIDGSRFKAVKCGKGIDSEVVTFSCAVNGRVHVDDVWADSPRIHLGETLYISKIDFMPFVHSDNDPNDKYWKIGTSRVNKFKGMKKGSTLNRSLDIFITMHNHPACLQQVRYNYTENNILNIEPIIADVDGDEDLGAALADLRRIDNLGDVYREGAGPDEFIALDEEAFKERRKDVLPETYEQLKKIKESELGVSNPLKKAKDYANKAKKYASKKAKEAKDFVTDSENIKKLQRAGEIAGQMLLSDKNLVSKRPREPDIGSSNKSKKPKLIGISKRPKRK